MRLPIPGPRDVVRAADQAYQALDRAVALIPRIAAVVAEIERILPRAQAVISRIEQTDLLARAVVARSDATVTATQTVVDAAAVTSAQVAPLLEAYQPALEQLQPVVDRLADTTSPDEVDAVVTLIDTLPQLVQRLDTDILPMLNTLGTVAPDLRDLLDVSKELNEMLGGLPGLGRIKKRIEERQEEEDELRADAVELP
jgi:ABC-type transporter Mla subunit MlaD